MVKSRLAISVVALALLAGACGDDDDDAGSDATAAAPATGGDTTAAPAGGDTTAAPAGGDTTAAGTAAPGGQGGSIEVTSLWGGAEADAFTAVTDAFTEETGIQVEYVSQRDDYSVVLSNRLEQGDPPDIAIIPGIGFLRSFAKDGVLIPLEDLGIDQAFLESAYEGAMAEVGLSVGAVDDTAYALMVKVNSKSTVWYRPDEFAAGSYEVPTTFDEWVALADQIKADGKTPLALGAADSWTLTDWFESVYLRQAGPEAYDKLFSAEGDWTDASVTEAVDTMFSILTSDNVVGGTDGALATEFTDGIGQVFSPEAQALMYYEGGFVGGIALGDVNPDLVWDETYGFFDFPAIGDTEAAVTIGGDVIAAFTSNPGVAEFMKYLASPEGGAAWAEGGTIISPFAGVDASAYPTENAKAEAEQIANAAIARYDGSDLLPGGSDLGAALQAAFQDPGSAADTMDAFQSEVDAAWEEQEG
jgi:alpha-glucoside transport system substrate-binding protein